MKKLFLVAVTAWCSVLAIAADDPKSYAAKEAAKHVGETATVTYVEVVRVTSSGLTLVNLDGR